MVSDARHVTLIDTSENKLFTHIEENHPTQIVIFREESLPNDNDIGNYIFIVDQIRPCAESDVKKRRCRSWIRKYMVKVKNRLYECNICQARLKILAKSYSNMIRHFKNKHQIIFAQETTKYESNEDEQMANQHFLNFTLQQDELGLLSVIKSTNFNEHETPTDKDADSKVSLGVISNKSRFSAWVRKYMVLVKTGLYECKICERSLRVSPRSLQSLKRHCKTQHPNIYAQETTNLKGSEEEDKQAKTRDSIKDAEKLIKNIDKNNDKVEEDTDTICCESDVDTGVKSSSKSDLSDVRSIETKVHELCRGVLTGNHRRRSLFWRFFKMNRKYNYKCKICDRNIVVHHGISNLKRHIKLVHQLWYRVIVELSASEPAIEEELTVLRSGKTIA